MVGRIDAHIGSQQYGFEFFVEVFVNLAAAKKAGQILAEPVARLGQADFQAFAPAQFGFRRGVNVVDHGIGLGVRNRFLRGFGFGLFLEETEHRFGLASVNGGKCRSSQDRVI